VDSLVAYLAGCGVHLPADSPAVATAAAAEGPALPSTTSSVTTSAGPVHSVLPLELQLPQAVNHVDTEFKAVAIVASAHHVPGGCLQPGASTSPVDRISRVPLDRWNTDEPALDNSSELSAAFGSFLSGADQFDPAPFHLSASEATLMDPQQRLLLESFAEAQSVFNTWDSHTSGSDRPAGSSGSSIKQQFGVYVGVSQLEYARITYETGTNLNAYYATGAH
jgi:acyl transferase domain-containing protein